MSGLSLSVVMLAMLVAMVTADTYITYYEHANHQGASNSWTLPGNGACENFELFNDRVSSVDTHGGKMSGLRLSVVMLAMLVAMVTADTYITYYEHANHQGASNSWTLPGNGACENFELFNDRISSVDTHNGCAILFVDANCQGRGVTFAPGTGFTGTLQNTKMSGLRLSFVMLAMLIAMVTADTYITYFEHANHQGSSNSWTLPGNGECINFALFNDRQNVWSPSDLCYVGHADCHGYG
ncbi:hypothetical protein B566_EDAN009369 [Ephemera danica]|nr:hypothetical protein B566_EDAN009369 [Ephemera danica]